MMQNPLTKLSTKPVSLPCSLKLKQNNEDPLMQKVAENRGSLFNYHVWESPLLIFTLMVNVYIG